MYPELTNLLPSERRRTIKRDYFLRLATVGVGALAAVVAASGALLIPSYLYVHQQIQVDQGEADNLDARIAALKGQDATAGLKTLSSDTDYLARLAGIPSASAAFRAVLAVPRPGVTLTGFTYTPPQQKNDGKLTITGMAATRETLRAYDEALTALPFVSNVDLPISAYAKDSDIQFTITLTGTLAP